MLDVWVSARLGDLAVPAPWLRFGTAWFYGRSVVVAVDVDVVRTGRHLVRAAWCVSMTTMSMEYPGAGRRPTPGHCSDNASQPAPGRSHALQVGGERVDDGGGASSRVMVWRGLALAFFPGGPEAWPTHRYAAGYVPRRRQVDP